MTRTQANLVLLAASLIWGSTFVVQQIGTGGFGAIMFTSLRFFLGAIVISPLALIQFKRRKNTPYAITRNDLIIMIITGLVLFLGATLQQRGIFYTSVANAGFLTGLYVPLVPFFAFTVLRSPIHWSIWPSSLACLAGTYAMSGAQSFHLGSGDIWVIASAFFWAIHVLLVGHIATKTQSPLVVALIQFATVGFAGLITGIIVEQPRFSDFNGAWFGILYAGCLSVGCGFTLQVVGQRFSHASDSAIILSSETVFAALAAFIFLGDRLTPRQLAGAALIFAGILAVQLIPLCLKKSR